MQKMTVGVTYTCVIVRLYSVLNDCCDKLLFA